MSVQAADALMAVFGFERVALRGRDESCKTAAQELEVGMGDKMREVASDEFISWHVGAFGFCNIIAPECYMRWLAWQSSRAALVVELPKIIDKEWACSSLECSFIKDGVRLAGQAIHAAGVSTR